MDLTNATKKTFRPIGVDELLVDDEAGQKILLDEEDMRTISEYYDLIKTRTLLESDPTINTEAELIDSAGDMAEYYIEMRDNALEGLHKCFLQYALDQIYADEREREREEYLERLSGEQNGAG